MATVADPPLGVLCSLEGRGCGAQREGQSGPEWKSFLLSSAVHLPGQQALRSRRQWGTEAGMCTDGHRVQGEMSEEFNCCHAPLSPEGLVLAGKTQTRSAGDGPRPVRPPPSALPCTAAARIRHRLGSGRPCGCHAGRLGSGGQRKPCGVEVTDVLRSEVGARRH